MVERLRRDERREQDDEGAGGNGAAELRAQRPILAEGPPTGLGATEPEEHAGELTVTSDGRHLETPPPPSTDRPTRSPVER